MNVDAITGPTGTLLRAALDAAQTQHQVLALNVANASVDGYVPMRASFGDELARLRDSLEGGGISRADAPEPVFEPAHDALGRLSERVEIDTEVAAIAQNTLHYQALLRGLSKHLSLLGLAIGEGKR